MLVCGRSIIVYYCFSYVQSVICHSLVRSPFEQLQDKVNSSMTFAFLKGHRRPIDTSILPFISARLFQTHRLYVRYPLHRSSQDLLIASSIGCHLWKLWWLNRTGDKPLDLISGLNVKSMWFGFTFARYIYIYIHKLWFLFNVARSFDIFQYEQRPMGQHWIKSIYIYIYIDIDIDITGIALTNNVWANKQFNYSVKLIAFYCRYITGTQM